MALKINSLKMYGKTVVAALLAASIWPVGGVRAQDPPRAYLPTPTVKEISLRTFEYSLQDDGVFDIFINTHFLDPDPALPLVQVYVSQDRVEWTLVSTAINITRSGSGTLLRVHDLPTDRFRGGWVRIVVVTEDIRIELPTENEAFPRGRIWLLED